MGASKINMTERWIWLWRFEEMGKRESRAPQSAFPGGKPHNPPASNVIPHMDGPIFSSEGFSQHMRVIFMLVFKLSINPRNEHYSVVYQ